MNKIYVFGAHSRGKTVAHYLCYLHPEIEIEAYLYDNEESNEKDVNGVPVIKLDENGKINTEYPVYIGTRGVSHPHIIQRLQDMGVTDIRPVTVEMDLQLRNAYLRKYYANMGLEFEKIGDLPCTDRKTVKSRGTMIKGQTGVCIYVAKSIYDKMLLDRYDLQEYEKEIQVGAALTEDRLVEVDKLDNEGENISALNKQFCELTALYWIWKNATEDVVGLVHYRRHFTMPEDWLQRMAENEVDVILPVPLYVVPNLEENYRSRHDGTDLDYLFSYVKENNQEEYDKMRAFWKNGRS